MKLDLYDDAGVGILYQHCTPHEAIAFSKQGTASGYDVLRWGEKHHLSPKSMGDPIVAEANKYGVRFLIVSELERQYIEGDGSPGGWKGSTFRRKYVNYANFFPWETLSRTNRDFIMSLLWVPVEPVSALEALATVAESGV